MSSVPREPPERPARRWARRLVEIGSSPADSDELRVRKSVLVLSTALMAALSSIWIVTYALLGLWLPAAIPLVYMLASLASLAAFARTGRYGLFRTGQLFMSLLLPFALQWSLGGFEAASAVSLWALTSPLGALLFVGARDSVPWFAAFVALTGLSAAIDPVLSDHAADVPQELVTAFFALNVIGVSATAYVLLQYFVQAREQALADSERLLLNAIPGPVATRLKRGEVIADHVPEATVLFADIVGFTALSQRLTAPALVALLDHVFARWDELAAGLGVEKIKTIGDEYMAAAGIPSARPDHAQAVADLALAMGPALAACAGAESPLAARIGIDSGPVVAGVIGRAKFSYDLWGDTVNTASRMESHAPAGSIQATERVYERLRNEFAFELRGAVEVKGKGPMTCYLLTARSAAAASR